MASLAFNKALEAWARGNLDFDSDPFKVLMTTNAYTENKDSHDFRDDITGEISGTGYTAGGNVVSVSVSLDLSTDRLDIIFGGTTWPGSTLTARKAVYYKNRGGSPALDEVVLVNDFGADVVTTAGTFTLNASTLRLQN